MRIIANAGYAYHHFKFGTTQHIKYKHMDFKFISIIMMRLEASFQKYVAEMMQELSAPVKRQVTKQGRLESMRLHAMVVQDDILQEKLEVSSCGTRNTIIRPNPNEVAPSLENHYIHLSPTDHRSIANEVTPRSLKSSESSTLILPLDPGFVARMVAKIEKLIKEHGGAGNLIFPIVARYGLEEEAAAADNVKSVVSSSNHTVQNAPGGMREKRSLKMTLMAEKFERSRAGNKTQQHTCLLFQHYMFVIIIISSSALTFDVVLCFNNISLNGRHH